MPVWVVPSVAADLWKLSVAEVMKMVEHARLTAKTEHGFTFVDIESRAAIARPLTFVPFQKDLPIQDADSIDPEPETIEATIGIHDGPGDSRYLLSLEPPSTLYEVRRESAKRRIPPQRRLAA